MSIKDYKVAPVSRANAQAFVIRYHYLHREAPVSWAWGLFDPAGFQVGVICYGTPSSSPLRSGICGPDESFNVAELTRLWIADTTPSNAESYLIGATIRQVGKEIIVAYSEPDEGHVGTVYQATNFWYTGLSAQRTNWVIDGIDAHSQTVGDMGSADVLRARYGDAFHLEDRPRKHRYVYFNANRRRRKELLKKLQYPVLPYPKADFTEPTRCLEVEGQGLLI